MVFLGSAGQGLNDKTTGFRNGYRSNQVAEWLALLTWDHEVLGLNLAGGKIQLMTVKRFISESLSLSPFHHLVLYKVERHKTPNHHHHQKGLHEKIIIIIFFFFMVYPENIQIPEFHTMLVLKLEKVHLTVDICKNPG